MARIVLFLVLATGFLLASCRTSQTIEQQLHGVETTLAGRRVLVVGDSISIESPVVEAPRRGFLSLGTGKNKQKNSGNITVNITHLDKRQDKRKTKSQDKTKINAPTVDKSTVKEKTDVVSKPTTKTTSEVKSKSKADDHAKTKTTQGGILAYIGLGAVGILFLIFLIRKKTRE